MYRIIASCLLLTGCLGLAGCSLAPRYERPAAPVAAQWPVDASVQAAGMAGTQAADIGWRQFFTDQPLQELIALALAHNRDLRTAALNIQKARGMYRIQRADLLPGVEAGRKTTSTSLTTGDAEPTFEQKVSVGVTSYELDLFGRVQSLKDAALESYFATEQGYKSAYLSLVAEVAKAYVTLIADRERLALSQETLRSQQKTYTMIQRRQELGVASVLDVRQAQTSVDTARVDIARYSGQIARDIAVLTLLVGTPLQDAMLPAQTLDSLVLSQDLPAGIPSDVLLQRPDIVQAEYQLKAANANIGAARANFFPRISLGLTLESGVTELAKLFTTAGVWNFVSQVTLPLFQGGRNMAELAVSEADKNIAVAAYEKAIQVAFQEVADALILRQALLGEYEAQTSLNKATADVYTLSYARYEKGVDSYLTVLIAQRAMYTAQMALITTRLNKEMNTIQLYKVLGGGWKE